jgi:lipopolysaccharide transport system ATP-binding protein
MSKPIIQVEGLSKKFIIAHEGRERYTALRDVMVNKGKGLLQKVERQPATKEEFWALKDVSFTINQGDRVGIIGRNGAGKSTLLKVLSRISEPTAGRISINGRVASLLEVGTGFHPELTGRENIFLNGAILGMSRAEIRSKFDEIVAFAEVEKFLDTPVKRYSSGMYVRLAFAVAAHLEPEILIVDEVLAVGDAQFQKKCLGKMEDVSLNEGRTVLFVSHNMAAIKTLCKTGIVLKSGKIVAQGEAGEMISSFMLKIAADEDNFTPISDASVDVLDFYLSSESGENSKVFRTSENVYVNIQLNVHDTISSLRVGFDLINSKGDVVFRAFDDDEDYIRRNAGPQLIRGIIPSNLLMQDEYSISLQVGIHKERWIVNERSFIVFKVEHMDGVNRNYKDMRPGLIMPMISWTSKMKHTR